VKKSWVMGIVVGLVVLALASRTTATDMKGKFGIGGNIGYAMMNIHGVNDWYDVADEHSDLFGWTTESTYDLKGGMSYLGEVKYGISSNLALTGSVGILSSKGKYTATGPTDVAMDDKVSATFFGAGVLYILPSGRENVNLSFGGGADYYTVKYEENLAENGTVKERRAEGSEIGFHLRGGVEVFLTEKIAIGGSIVYRIAKLEEIETKKDDWGISPEGQPLKVYTDPWFVDTENLEINLGGINAYVTIYLYFG